jgi:methyl-accepting chemotaxis protein
MSVAQPQISIFKTVFATDLVTRSLFTALVVGSVLNIINQSDGVFGDAELEWISFVLTYFVPYCVSTYSGALSNVGHAKQVFLR